MLVLQTTTFSDPKRQVMVVVGLLAAMFALGACESAPQSADASVQQTYQVSGSVNGLSGTLHLVLDGSELVTVSADGDFTFTGALVDGDSYQVTAFGQPAGQVCTIANASGAIAGADVDNLVVACTDTPGPFTVGGTVSGLSGQLHLVLGNIDALASRVTEVVVTNADGSFEFASALADGDSYVVGILGQPEGQDCVVIDGAGMIVGTDVNVAVECADVPGPFTVSGTVSGLSGQLHLVLSGSELVTVSTDGDFAFVTPLDDSDTYEVTTIGEPDGQTCTVSNGSGIVAGSDVTGVVVDCQPS